METLPVEMLWHIARFLPERDRGALRLTSSWLAQALPLEECFDLELNVIRSRNPEFWEYMLPRLPEASYSIFVLGAIQNRVDDVAVRLTRAIASSSSWEREKECILREALESGCYPVVALMLPSVNNKMMESKIRRCFNEAVKCQDLECIGAICRGLSCKGKQWFVANMWPFWNEDVGVARCIKESLNITLEDVWYDYELYPRICGVDWFLLQVFGWKFVKYRLWVRLQFKSENHFWFLALSGTLLLIYWLT